MTVTIVETRTQARAITGGVDTHADVHVAAALDPLGGLLGVQEFPATPPGYARLLEWLGGFGTVGLVGIEGTGSYGAGLARHIAAAGIRVVEVDRSDRQDRRRRGKSDPLDAVSAARAAQSGRASGAPKGRDGQVEAIRALMVAKRTARSERIQTINQARSLIVTGPDDLRARFAGHATDDLAAELAALRPRPGSMIRYHTLLSLRELGRRVAFLDGQLQRLDALIVPLLTARAPGLLSLYGVGHDTAAKLLIAAGDHPERLRSEAAWAHLCATAPIPASSGKVTRHRLNPGGDRQANHALYRIVITRMSSHPPTRAYVARRTKEGLSKKEIIRCLKRYVAREVYPHLRPGPADAQAPGAAWPPIRLPHPMLARERFAGRPRPPILTCCA
jgi:transposase